MKEIINLLNLYLKKRGNLIAIIIIILSIIGISLNVNIIVSDELWNFQNIYKMYNGFELYKDANVIITPLFFYIGNLFFYIFGANFLSFRLYNIIIDIILFFSTYVLCKKLKIPKAVSLIIVLIFIVIDKYNIILTMANYNILALAFYVIGVICFLKEKLTVKDFILQGIITFFIIFTKQNIGIFYLVAIITLIFLEKVTIKKKIINIIALLAPVSILGIVVAMFFYYFGILNDFINYTVLGIVEFGQKNVDMHLPFFICVILVNALNIFIIKVMYKKRILKDKEYKKAIKLMIFSIFSSFFMFPIVNRAHFVYGMYLSLILLMYIINYISLNIFKYKYLKIIKYITFIFVCITISSSLLSYMNWKENKITDEDSPYYGGVMQEELDKKIRNISEYIKNSDKKVIVLSADAALYMINLKESNGKMDLPFKGNLGHSGEKGLIEELSKLQDIEILIKKEEKEIQWQESKQVRKFIINTYQYQGEIEDYMIYSIKNK